MAPKKDIIEEWTKKRKRKIQSYFKNVEEMRKNAIYDAALLEPLTKLRFKISINENGEVMAKHGGVYITVDDDHYLINGHRWEDERANKIPITDDAVERLSAHIKSVKKRWAANEKMELLLCHIYSEVEEITEELGRGNEADCGSLFKLFNRLKIVIGRSKND